MSEYDLKIDQATNPEACMILAHGAGAGMNSDFMQWMTDALVAKNISVVRFNFDYMAKALTEGKRRPPEKADKLLCRFNEVVDDVLAQPTLQSLPLFIGGKSMGGRMSTLLLAGEDSPRLHGAIVYGYPFHPPGKPEKLRVEHLLSLTSPLLIVQGERDTFGREEEIEGYTLSEQVRCLFLADGDHSFKPRKASGYSQVEHIQTAAQQTYFFIREQL